MEKEHTHITEYAVYGKILVILLLLTTATITVTWINLSAWTVAAALLIACIKAGVVLTYFMHLKFDNLLLKILVSGVLLLFAAVLIITFFDYFFR
jgi:cytochrome c oxidase subunit 4